MVKLGAAVSLAAAVVTAMPAAATPVERYVPVLAIGDRPPALAMLDERGRAVTWDTWLGRTLIVGFIYTRCHDAGACPLVSAKFAAMQRRSAGMPLHFIEVTLDPQYDRPAVLARYGREFGADSARWTLVTGAPPALHETARRFGILAGDDAEARDSHAEGLVLIGSDGRLADRIDGNAWRAEEVVAQARTLASLPSSPWLRLRLSLRAGVGALCAGGASGISFGAALALLLLLLCAGAVIAMRASRDAVRR